MNRPVHQHPGWREVHIRVHPVAHEAVNAFLFDLGCTGTVSEERDGDLMVAYFPSHASPQDLRSRILSFSAGLAEIFPGLPHPRVSIHELAHQDWGLEWRRFFHRVQVTDRLLIVPPWEEPPVRGKGLVIRIDPGPAFGTGLHPTTQMCLAAMEKAPFPSVWSFLDVGTGSGILSIYASMLGADRVLGVDIDEDALRWAEHNLALNGLSEAVDLQALPAGSLKGPFFMVAANLMFREILGLLDDLKRLTEAGGWLILSGVLEEQSAELKGRLEEVGMSLRETVTRGEWVCMIARNCPGET